MSRIVTDAFFLESASGARCFCVMHRPVDAPRGVVLHVPAFAEEMNKSRRMVALSARAFAEDGWITLVLDLAGCGDSSGDLQEFGWDDWLKDIDAAVQWATTQASGPIILWGLRAGCPLACDWLRTRARTLPVLFWQPVANGKQHLTQFLRIKAASEMMSEADERGSVAALRTSLEAGECVEVAGYTVTPSLAKGMSATELSLPASQGQKVLLMELVSGNADTLSPATRIAVEKWKAAGVTVFSVTVRDLPFWNSIDIRVSPKALDASRLLLGEAGSW